MRYVVLVLALTFTLLLASCSLMGLFDADPVVGGTCDTGDTREVVCGGLCGNATQRQVCGEDGSWGDPGECIDPDDVDGDGYARPGCDDGEDCDDSNPEVHPGAAEGCDTIDNDCDGDPSDTENDHDGDGYVAESCGGPDCNDDDSGINPGADEECGDLNDPNCDGAIGPDLDEDGFGDSECGGEDCDDSNGLISPDAPELCNGLDDNCDEALDEGFECVANTEGTCATVCGSTGARRCSPECTWSSCTTPAETCNGMDDDCDEEVDEGFECRVGQEQACETTCGTSGLRRCSDECGWEPCMPPNESCNGVDDDCDLEVDEGEEWECALGEIDSCETECGSSGRRTCIEGCTWGACVPPEEVCNGVDDNCNDEADELFDCVLASERVCTTSCGTIGSHVCVAGCIWSECGVVEVCNGRDDNCNDEIDELFECARGSTESCETSCGTTGSLSCHDDCTRETECTPPPEECNGEDDDCDGEPMAGEDDDGDGYFGPACGDEDCDDENPEIHPGSEETCNLLDDNCDGRVDEPLLLTNIDRENRHYAVVPMDRFLVTSTRDRIQVVDITTRLSPVVVSQVPTASTVHDIAIFDGYGYLAESTLEVVDLHDVEDPEIVFSLPVVGGIRDLEIAGHYLYAAVGRAGLVIFDISVPFRPAIVGSVDTDGDASSVVIFEDYILVACGESGISILDLTDADSPEMIAFVGTESSANSVAVRGGFAFVADGIAGLTVLDVSTISEPEHVVTFPLAADANSVEIDSEHAFVATSTGMIVLNIGLPSMPRIVENIEGSGEGTDIKLNGGLAIVEVEDGGVDLFELVCYSCSSIGRDMDEDGYIDIACDLGDDCNDSDPGVYPGAVEVCNGLDDDCDGLLGLIDDMDEDGYVPAECGGSDCDDGDAELNPDATEVCRNGIDEDCDGNLDLPAVAGRVLRMEGREVRAMAIEGDRFYACTGWTIFEFDLEDSANPELLGSTEDSDEGSPIHGCVSDFVVLSGLAYIPTEWFVQVVDLTDIARPVAVGEIAEGIIVYSMVESEGLLHMFSTSGDLLIYDVETPGAPTELGAMAIPGEPFDMEAHGDHLFIAGGGVGLVVVDVSVPASPRVVGGLRIGHSTEAITIVDSYIFTVSGTQLYVVDISDPTSPREVGSLESEEFGGLGMGAFGDYLFLGHLDHRHFAVIDISEPETPELLSTTGLDIEIRGLIMKAPHVYLRDSIEGFQVVDTCALPL